MKSSEVRNSFVQYFKKQGHTHVPSSSLIPENDPTLLFANAGMNQFKNLFLGIEKRDYQRAVTSQKCVRAGGKHNDLENVGFTARHHTFFEMLGNFSFGDYFKKEAIHFAWEFLTKDLKLDKNKLFVTVFENDDEAAEIWHKQEGVPKERIFRFGEKDNFWRMGDTGPCGPCSEIFFDRGEQYGKIKDPYQSIASGEDRIIEIWNLVFMQFFEKSPGVMEPLPKPSVDTGSGLERVVAVVQNRLNNFDTDVFSPMIEAACKVGNFEYVNDAIVLAKHPELLEKTSALRVLADHCRATAFLIADGALPANEGRGYVLRRIMRRAIRYGSKLSETSLLYPMVDSVIASFSEFYPELKNRQSIILSTVKDEESRFRQTLSMGSEILESEIKNLKSKNQKILSGSVLFKLYDTYGFPVDLSKIIALEKGIEADEAEFENILNESKVKARSSWKGKSSSDSDQTHLLHWVSELKQKKVVTEFLGYACLVDKVKVISLSNGHEKVEFLKAPQTGYIITDKTCFYAESGGQVGDQGEIHSLGGSKAKVFNTTKINDIFIHEVEVIEGELRESEIVEVLVESKLRQQIASNHSATHLLHSALRKVLGESVTQAGSLVESKKLRFDFTYNKSLSVDELQEVENLVNGVISQNHPVSTHLMSYPEAVKFGAMALFGEKYGDQVRVLKMGDFSCELCGGTHVKNTSEIRVFKIMSESGVSSGVRRIEAITGDVAFKFLFKNYSEVKLAKEKAQITENWEIYLDKPELDLPLWIENKKLEIKNLEREVKQSKIGQIDIDSIVKNKSTSVSGIGFVVTQVSTSDRESLAEIADKLKNKLQSGLVMVLGDDEAMLPLVVSVTKDFTGKLKAGDVIKKMSVDFTAKGGGRPDFAQGSVGLKTEVKSVEKWVKENL